MTTQQQPQQPQTGQPQDVALRVGRLEGLMEAVIGQQRTFGTEVNARFSRLEDKVDRLLYAIIGGFIALLITILGSRFIE